MGGGQDTEEAAEFVATVRGEHVPMKEWFNNNSHSTNGGVVVEDDENVVRAELRRRFGPYPSLWKEVLNWPGWKETRRAYLRHLQQMESVSSNNNNNNGQQQQQQSAAAAAAVGTATATTATTIGTGTTDQTQQQQQHQQPSSSDGQTDGPRRKRKSRWGTSTEAAAAAAAAPGNTNDANKRPSFIPQQTHPAAAPLALPGNNNHILDGSSSFLTAHQQEELRKMQAQLRVVNERMENLEAKAARIDALPRGHCERSPSPPPSMYLNKKIYTLHV
jgi:hypothetical protein